MHESIVHTHMEDREITVHISGRARRALDNRKVPLHVNMALYFSCFVKKIVTFSDAPIPAEAKVTENLFASFRPVQSKSCNIHELGKNSEPTLIDLPVVKRKAIIPRHLMIDFKKGNWKGDFTWNLK
jgi:hypothetical protein